ncbi:MAG: TrkA family potassium uptake protein [Candidatus Microthrix parvicella]|nr:TrkA family potassium uptake protein [Candidatus Microthrix parvicella]
MGHADTVLVIGLGRFGSALAISLEEMGHDVMGVDLDPNLVADHASALSHVLEADTTRLETLRQIGAEDVSAAVVAIGTDIEASILTTAALVDLEVPSIWAKALTGPHARILERIGATEVVFPERDMGVRVAHQVTRRMIDWFQLDDGFALVEAAAPVSMIGKTLEQLKVRSRFGITVVSIKPMGAPFTYATADTVIGEGDILLVAANTDAAERFTRQK